MREVRKRTDMYDPARLDSIEAMVNRLDRYKILFDSEDQAVITDALKVHAALIRMFEEEKK